MAICDGGNLLEDFYYFYGKVNTFIILPISLMVLVYSCFIFYLASVLAFVSRFSFLSFGPLHHISPTLSPLATIFLLSVSISLPSFLSFQNLFQVGGGVEGEEERILSRFHAKHRARCGA